ncbi:MAG TPA: hypothetical protein VFF85_13240 [Microbacterium sp.]|nr:hypothetical protein [Microbacterium sp.]
MGSEDDAPEETVKLTRRARRRSQSEAVDADVRSGADEVEVEVEDRTVVMGRRTRGGAAETESDDDDESAVEDRTVVMGRRRRPDAEVVEPDDGLESDGDLDGGSALIEDRTVAVDRGRRAATAPEDAAIEERTVAVRRRRRSDAVAEPAIDDEGLYDTVSRPPAVAEEAPPPAIYKPRAAPRTPHRPPVAPGDNAPTRVLDADRISVTKAARRRSLYAMAAVSVACVVSLVGLVLLGFTVFA